VNQLRKIQEEWKGKLPKDWRQATELQKRVVTAAVGATALILLFSLGGRLGVALFAAVLSLAMLWEFVEISFELDDKFEKRWTLLAFSWLVSFLSFLAPDSQFIAMILVFMTLFAYFLLTAKRHSGPAFQQHLRELIYSVFAFLYLSIIPGFLPMLYFSQGGLHWVLVFLLINWSGDVGAYFAGKKYGKRKLYPEISPKKTWEGAAGGLASSIAIVILYKVLFFQALSLGSAILVPLVVAPVAQMGDLCESFIKRAFGKKDSGGLLPGHGGFLDRFDGVVFSLPVMYACVRILG
jgi:phosphatidate cytidylyltransferase